MPMSLIIAHETTPLHVSELLVHYNELPWDSISHNCPSVWWFIAQWVSIAKVWWLFCKQLADEIEWSSNLDHLSLIHSQMCCRMNTFSTGIILCKRPANERRCYNVTSSLIGWAFTENAPCINTFYSSFYPHLSHLHTFQHIKRCSKDIHLCLFSKGHGVALNHANLRRP